MRSSKFSAFLLLGSGTPGQAQQAQGQIDNATSLHGFSISGINKLNSVMREWVDKQDGPGIETLLSRNGEIINHDVHGWLDTSAKARNVMQKDTIFRIMSMTKPIVGVAMMMMYDEGRWRPEDLVEKHIPEFKDLKVKSSDGSYSPQKTTMTMAHLLSHSAGFPGILTVLSPTLKTIISPLVSMQLDFQPGTDWKYGPGVEIQGYLIEKWSGKDLADFMSERIFEPLGMVDTGFFVEPSKVKRVARIHGKMFGKWTPGIGYVPTMKPIRLIPSGGLYGTAKDYWKVCQLLLNNGSFNGKQYLKPESVKLMQQNVLASDVHVGFGSTRNLGTGFGLDLAITIDSNSAKDAEPKGSYFWSGAFGTWFWNDPTNNISFVGMIQSTDTLLDPYGSLWAPNSLKQKSARAVYGALTV
jgi:CubicO group peptidase (beta-lactamase class C family)